MRRKRLPGTRNPLSCPLSKHRIIVCWLTLQILAASPVVNTVLELIVYRPFISTPNKAAICDASSVRYSHYDSLKHPYVTNSILPSCRDAPEARALRERVENPRKTNMTPKSSDAFFQRVRDLSDLSNRQLIPIISILTVWSISIIFPKPRKIAF